MSDNVIWLPNATDETRQPRSGIEQRVLDALDEGLGVLEDDLIDEADRAAIDNEDVFVRRFRFDAPREHRRQLIELKHQADLTDREIRLLHHAGCLCFSANDARLSTPLYITAWGWLQLAGLWSLMGLGFLVSTRVAAPSMIQIAQMVAVEFALLAACWGVFQLHVRPRRISKRVHDRLRTQSELAD